MQYRVDLTKCKLNHPLVADAILKFNECQRTSAFYSHRNRAFVHAQMDGMKRQTCGARHEQQLTPAPSQHPASFNTDEFARRGYSAFYPICRVQS